MPYSSVPGEKSEAALVSAAKAGDEAAFRQLVEPLSRELSAYAYRMLGGFHDAEDVLQETRLKAWKNLASYESAGGNFRAWLYRIATNTALDVLRTERRRVFPREVGPSVAPGPPTTERRDDILWLEPYPDALLPDSALERRETIRLAFIRALQVLPARQRAALILHDVLDFRVDEIATMLESTDAAINSALQRARATLKRDEGPADIEVANREALAKFTHAWTHGDFEGVIAMLTEDVIMNMPPWEYWLDGREAVVETMTSHGTWGGEPRPGRYRIVAAPMNGEPAGMAYVDFGEGWVPVCLTVMTLASDGRISEMNTFVLPRHFEEWGYR